MQRLVFALALLLVVPSTEAASDCQGDVATLRALYDLRQQIVSPYGHSVTSRVDQHIDELREPLAGGGYRWVRWVRPAGDAPVQKLAHTIRRDFGDGDPETFEAAGERPFAVRIVSPRKRSLFKANKESYVGRVEVRYWVDGKVKTITRDIDQWMTPDTSKTIDLGAIAERAEVVVEAAARNASREESLLEVHFRQAVAEDDPENPNYDAIRTLRRVRDTLGSASGRDIFAPAAAIDYEIARAEKRLFPELTPLPYATITLRFREADRLMRSEKPEEQEEGRKLFAETLRMSR